MVLVFGVIGGAKSDAAARQCHDRDTGMAAAITVCIVVELGSWGFFTPSWWQVAKGWGSAVVLVSGYLYLSLCRCIHSIPYRYTIKRACWREGAVAGCFVLCLVLTGFGRSWRDDCSCFCCVCAVCLFVCLFLGLIGAVVVVFAGFWVRLELGCTGTGNTWVQHNAIPTHSSPLPRRSYPRTHTHTYTQKAFHPPPPSSPLLSSTLPTHHYHYHSNPQRPHHFTAPTRGI